LPYRIPLIEDCGKQTQQKTFLHILTWNPKWNERGATMAQRYEENISNANTFVASSGTKTKMARKGATKNQSAAGKTGNEARQRKEKEPALPLSISGICLSSPGFRPASAWLRYLTIKYLDGTIPCAEKY
jgi:hypothetical protein